MEPERNLALSTLELLANATGAEFEDQDMAVQIIEQLIIETFKNGQIDNKDFSKSCTCKSYESSGETWCCNNCGLPTSVKDDWIYIKSLKDEDKQQSFNALPKTNEYYDIVLTTGEIQYRYYYFGDISSDRWVENNVTHFCLSPVRQLPKR